MTQRFKSLDFSPNYIAAGVQQSSMNETAAVCVKPQNLDVPATPDRIKKYRQSQKHAFGVTNTHYGKVNDQMPPQEFVYGLKSPKSTHTTDVLKDDALEGLKGYMRELQEAKYNSNKKEPFAKTLDRQYKWPTDTQKGSFSFGISSIPSEPAKGVLYSHPAIFDDEQTKQLYIKTHQQYDAGQQKKRDYQWPFDPKGHSFGKDEKPLLNGAKLCLQPEAMEETFPKTKIVSKNREDFRDFAYPGVGVTKNLGQTSPTRDPSHVYGYKTKNVETWTSGNCIHGDLSSPTLASPTKVEENLGKSTKFGYRNVPHNGDEQRVFGLPTIRSDILKPRNKSVADVYNYGDEPEAVALLFPQRFAELGVNPQDFAVLRPKEDLRRLFSNIGYAYKAGKFEGIFLRAQQICNSQDEDTASVRAFIQAVKEMDQIE